MFSSISVRADCGMLHNSDYDLCGTGFECAIRLWLLVLLIEMNLDCFLLLL